MEFPVKPASLPLEVSNLPCLVIFTWWLDCGPLPEITARCAEPNLQGTSSLLSRSSHNQGRPLLRHPKNKDEGGPFWQPFLISGTLEVDFERESCCCGSGSQGSDRPPSGTVLPHSKLPLLSLLQYLNVLQLTHLKLALK